jgi:hypothetical protein
VAVEIHRHEFTNMRTFILIGKSRKTGKDELILGREAKGSDHIAKYKELAAERTSEDYENVVLVESAPFKRPLKFITKAEAQAREEAAKAAAAKAEKEAAKNAKPAKSPKPPKGGPAKESAAEKEAAKNENQTGTETGANSEQ